MATYILISYEGRLKSDLLTARMHITDLINSRADLHDLGFWMP
ncbi:hypothetical protein [Pedobacter agri]|nr:hypothetical protein [Pedobacter agri]MDQ1142639.1 hypothetical protein [Pedobacter agri]